MMFIGTSLVTYSNGHSIKNSIDKNQFSTILDNIILQDPEPLFTKETFMVEMSDGIRLATDVYLPDGGSPPPGYLLWHEFMD